MKKTACLLIWASLLIGLRMRALWCVVQMHLGAYDIDILMFAWLVVAALLPRHYDAFATLSPWGDLFKAIHQVHIACGVLLLMGYLFLHGLISVAAMTEAGLSCLLLHCLASIGGAPLAMSLPLAFHSFYRLSYVMSV